MSTHAAARESARDRSTGQFGEQPHADPGALPLGATCALGCGLPVRYVLADGDGACAKDARAIPWLADDSPVTRIPRPGEPDPVLAADDLESLVCQWSLELAPPREAADPTWHGLFLVLRAELDVFEPGWTYPYSQPGPEIVARWALLDWTMPSQPGGDDAQRNDERLSDAARDALRVVRSDLY